MSHMALESGNAGHPLVTRSMASAPRRPILYLRWRFKSQNAQLRRILERPPRDAEDTQKRMTTTVGEAERRTPHPIYKGSLKTIILRRSFSMKLVSLSFSPLTHLTRTVTPWQQCESPFYYPIRARPCISSGRVIPSLCFLVICA
jgi:hypothetical protein